MSAARYASLFGKTDYGLLLAAECYLNRDSCVILFLRSWKRRLIGPRNIR